MKRAAVWTIAWGGLLAAACGAEAKGVGGTMCASVDASAIINQLEMPHFPEAGAASWDGGACEIDSVRLPYSSPLSGAFSGASLSGVVCAGGTYAYLAPTSTPGQYGLAILNTGQANAPGEPPVQFSVPHDATSWLLQFLIGAGMGGAGSYGSATSCGYISLGAVLPVPPSVDCRAAGSTPSSCPPGCTLGSTPRPPNINGCSIVVPEFFCEPLPPSIVFQATGTSNCEGGAMTPQGSWDLSLTSVTPYETDAGAPAASLYIVHGSLVATLVGMGADAGLATTDLSLTF